MHVIANGVNLQLFTPLTDLQKQAKLRQSLNIKEDEAVIMYVGGLQPWQDITTLIQASKTLKINNKKHVLVIVGDGLQREYLEKEANRLQNELHIILTGKIPYSEVADYIGIADICTLPRTKEVNEKTGLSPIKLYSYLACGKPIVATKIDGFEFLEEEKMGSLVPIGDAEAFAVAMKKWLEKPVDREEQRMRIRTYAETHCGWDRTARQVLEVCRRVV